MEFQTRADFGAFIPSQLDEYPLDPFEFRLYARIVRRAGNNGCFESLPKMAAGCKMGLTKARAAIRVLAKAGFIQLVDRSNKGLSHLCWITSPSEWVNPELVETIRKSLARSRNDTLIESDTPIELDSPPLSDQIPEGNPIKGIQISSSHKEAREGENFEQEETSPKSPDSLIEETESLQKVTTTDLRQHSAAATALKFSGYAHPTQKCDDRLNRKLDPWQLSDAPNDYDPGFLEYLCTDYLPRSSFYKGTLLIPEDAEGWINKRVLNQHTKADVYSRWKAYQKLKERASTRDVRLQAVSRVEIPRFTSMQVEEHRALALQLKAVGEESFKTLQAWHPEWLKFVRTYKQSLVAEVLS